MNDDTRQRALDRLRSAARFFYLLAALQMFTAVFAARFFLSPLPPPGSSRGVLALIAQNPRGFGLALVVIYAVSCAVSIVIGVELTKRKKWARAAGFGWAALHACYLFLFFSLGGYVLLYGLLGLVTLVSLAVANGLGAFEA